MFLLAWLLTPVALYGGFSLYRTLTRPTAIYGRMYRGKGLRGR